MDQFIMMFLFAAAAVSALVLSLGYLSILFARRRAPKPCAPFGVSVLKPLKGEDEGLLDNLRAIAQQDYPDFEIIFCAEDPADPALTVARKVQAEFPRLPIRVVAGAWPVGLNPKVRLLRRMQNMARHEWILISDSNVRPPRDYLTRLCATQRQSGADLVHSPLAGSGGHSWGGRLEELQLNGWVSASIYLSHRLGHSCVIGKSMLLRLEALAEVGGFQAVEDILAEDYILGAKLQKANKKVALSTQLLPVVTGRGSVGHFFNRHIRWGQMRRHISPGFYLFELTGNPTPFFLALAFLAPAPENAFFWWAQGVKWSADAFIYLLLTPRPSPLTLLLMPLKDALVLVMWVLGGIRRTVNWRGRRLRVGAGSRLTPVIAAKGAESSPPWRTGPGQKALQWASR